MNGIVVIRAPGILLQIHRAQLAQVQIGPIRPTCVQWIHIGDHEWTEFDVDVLHDFDNKTDYAKVAHDLFFFVIADMRETGATLTWDGEAWNVYYCAPNATHTARCSVHVVASKRRTP